MSNLDKKLRDILELFHNYDMGSTKDGATYAIAQIHQAFEDGGYTQGYVGADSFPLNPRYTDEQLKAISEELSKPRMTGQEWYDRFVAEYHMRADWISADPEMGDDAEHDVLLAARLASGIEETE